MRYPRGLKISALLAPIIIPAVIIAAEDHFWHAGTAITMPQGHWEKGLFQPLRYGRTDRLEWSTYLIFNPVVPNIRIKVGHSGVQSWQLASRYSIHYPTPMLRLLRRPGTGGMITPDPDVPEIPRILALNVEMMASNKLYPAVILTGRIGIGLALRSGRLDQRALIELPVVYPRMMRYRHGYQLTGGTSLSAGIWNRLHVLVDAGFFLIPGVDQSFAWEHKGLAWWRLGKRIRLLAGYELTYGEYPFGKQWHLLPLVDLQWIGQRK